MRTTIEIADEAWARLRELAARRGEKNPSTIVQEALDHYLRADTERQIRSARALAALGSLDPGEADHLEEKVRAPPTAWRCSSSTQPS